MCLNYSLAPNAHTHTHSVSVGMCWFLLCVCVCFALTHSGVFGDGVCVSPNLFAETPNRNSTNFNAELEWWCHFHCQTLQLDCSMLAQRLDASPIAKHSKNNGICHSSRRCLLPAAAFFSSPLLFGNSNSLKIDFICLFTFTFTSLSVLRCCWWFYYLIKEEEEEEEDWKIGNKCVCCSHFISLSILFCKVDY